MKRRTLVFILVPVAAALAGASAFALRRVPVATAPIVRGKAIEAAYANATVEALDRAVVKSKVSGTVAEIAVREGAVVKKGDVLARIDAPGLYADLVRVRSDQVAASQHAGAQAPQLAVLEAQSAAAEVQLKAAREEAARAARLSSSNAISQSELEQANSRASVLEAQLASYEAQKRALRIDLTARVHGTGAAVDSMAARYRDTEVRSPIDGVILHRSVEVGEVVTTNQLLFRVGDVSKLIIECAVDEADIARVRQGTKGKVSFRAYPRQFFAASVFEIVPDADRERHAFLVKMNLDSPPAGLKSGMGGEVNLILDERDGVLLAPADAIDRRGFAWFVEGGRARRRQVELGIRETRGAEIVKGAREGESIVVTGVERLTEDARVVVTVGPGVAPPEGSDGARTASTP